MTFYYQNSEWLGYICEVIIRQVTQMCKTECNGCKDGKKSAILHLHKQLSLLEKLNMYFQRVRGSLTNHLPEIYKHIQAKLPHSDDAKKDEQIYLDTARLFLLACSPELIYWGRYVTEENDSFIAELFAKKKRKKKEQ